ncbi:hypothetical protein [Arcobacter aquimarinus]|uniref:Uncharacterized protein n=1 Tax=Arcobacter aquimarinus TaxID=1315211 RepID=A0AAE7B2U2_9BACT|nr:hypothetical protein [Arcobacter aquimarinus]QKE26533.1 hypothetical protein AAQM_1795 [Arcobacter aquimarinus]RXI34129.1 hypothetical protein CP986_09580 [Arcobacter aquimarinus]
MQLIVVGIVTIVLILLFIIVFLLINSSSSKQVKTKVINQNLNQVIDLDEIRFPRNVENMNGTILSQACKVIIDSYRALNYANKLPSAMDKIEWHTWQVSILLFFLKSKYVLNISNSNQLFHETILNLSKNHINQDMQKILKKYLDNANVDKDRDTLSKDVIWTAREVSIILHEILELK